MIRSFGFVLAGALVLSACACGPLDPNDRLMTDDELITTFHRERAAFDSLATMLGEDRKIRFLDSYALYLDTGGTYNSHHDPGASTPEMPAARWDTYERLLRRIRVGRNVWSDDEHILLQQYVRKSGFDDLGWMRGYWYARQPLPRRAGVRSTDLLADPTRVAPPPAAPLPLYRHLDGPWYLFSVRGGTD